MKLKAIFTTIGGFMKKNLPSILTGSAIATGTASVVLTVPATIKAYKAVEAAKAELGRDLTKGEIFKICLKFYIPPLALLVTAIICSVMSNVESSKRITALAAAYAMSEEKLEGVRKKVFDKLGADKASEVLSSAEEERVKNEEEEEGGWYKAYQDSQSYLGEGCSENIPELKQLYRDGHTNRFFRASPIDIVKAEYNINDRLNSYEDMSLNSVYDEITMQCGCGDDLSAVKDGDYIGWQGGHDSIKFDTTLSGISQKSGESYIWLNYRPKPLNINDRL